MTVPSPSLYSWYWCQLWESIVRFDPVLYSDHWWTGDTVYGGENWLGPVLWRQWAWFRLGHNTISRHVNGHQPCPCPFYPFNVHPPDHVEHKISLSMIMIMIHITKPRIISSCFHIFEGHVRFPLFIVNRCEQRWFNFFSKENFFFEVCIKKHFWHFCTCLQSINYFNVHYSWWPSFIIFW